MPPPPSPPPASEGKPNITTLKESVPNTPHEKEPLQASDKARVIFCHRGHGTSYTNCTLLYSDVYHLISMLGVPLTGEGALSTDYSSYNNIIIIHYYPIVYFLIVFCFVFLVFLVFDSSCSYLNGLSSICLTVDVVTITRCSVSGVTIPPLLGALSVGLLYHHY